MTNTRDLEKEIEELANDLDDRLTDDDDPPTKADLGVSADFIRFEGDELPEAPEGCTWERKENETDAGADFDVAVRESDMVEENGAKFVAFTENTEEDDEEEGDR